MCADGEAVDDQLHVLVSRAVRKDQDAFAALIERFERAALALAFSILHNRAAASAGDVVQDAFIKAWTELHRLEDPKRFAGWLMQIVRNTALDARRRIQRRGTTVSEFPDLASADAGPAYGMEERETAGEIQSALAELDETTRAAVMLRYYDGLNSREIAELLDLTPPAIDMRLSRARKELQGKLSHLVQESPVGEKP
jgi:RNA polymerase sigma factor (sigma-70 family)